MRKASKIVLIINLIIDVLALGYFIYLLFSTFDVQINISSSASNSATSGSTSGGSSSGTNPIIIFALFPILLGIVMIRILAIVGTIGVAISIICTSIALYYVFNAKDRKSITAIAIVNIILGSLPGGILMLCTKPREYEEKPAVEVVEEDKE